MCAIHAIQDEPFRKALMSEVESSAFECFYGKHLGFYHHAPIKSLLQVIVKLI